MYLKWWPVGHILSLRGTKLASFSALSGLDRAAAQIAGLLHDFFHLSYFALFAGRDANMARVAALEVPDPNLDRFDYPSALVICRIAIGA